MWQIWPLSTRIFQYYSILSELFGNFKIFWFTVRFGGQIVRPWVDTPNRESHGETVRVGRSDNCPTPFKIVLTYTSTSRVNAFRRLLVCRKSSHQKAQKSTGLLTLVLWNFDRGIFCNLVFCIWTFSEHVLCQVLFFVCRLVMHVVN